MFEGVYDLEGNGLLDASTIDYLACPYALKPTFRLWCAVIVDIDTSECFRYVLGDPEQRQAFIDKFAELDHIIGHNILDYDMLALKLYMGFEYGLVGKSSDKNNRSGIRAWVQCPGHEKKYVYLTDTLVVSKCTNPDRYGGHSLDEWGKRLGLDKIDWRAKAVELGLIESNAPKGAEFQQYHPEMLVYNERDCQVNVKLYYYLLEEMGEWDWQDSLELEHFTRDIITRQSHRGFWFDYQLAVSNVKDLDEKMEAIRVVVEPLIPPKEMGVTKLKAYMPPKIQFKKNGEVSAVMEKWVARHEGVIGDVGGLPHVRFKGSLKDWKLPMDCEVPILDTEPAAIIDTTHIKGWLVELGWKPTQYKERDLTCDTKKNKLTKEKFEATVERWVEQTFNSAFKEDRLTELKFKRNDTKAWVLHKLKGHDMKRPLKVYTNPTLTVGQEKEIDPALVKFGEENETFPHAKLLSEYLTYRHRRNSILGGGVDPDDLDEDDEYAGKGFLASERIQIDGRIPTPADTCGAGTSRFKHKLVANIARVTSLYGDKMRAQFGVDVSQGMVQMGYDFASLEAMIESHFCWRYDDEEKSYCKSLVLEKPNDVHTKTAKLIQDTVGAAIGKEFPFARQSAKPVKYACAYGAQPARVAKTVGCSVEIATLIHGAYWEAAAPLAALGEKLKKYWENQGGKKFILGLDGRKIPTRSASALINSLFQSSGVICAKRAMVLHEKKMKEAGLLVDFFRDDWQNRVFVQQLIAYHDEAQLEMHKSLVKWKLFKTEEEAKAFKKENAGWSEVGHSEKGYYIGDCKAGRMIQEAVVETSRYYKLNVTLSADYIMGANWAQCH